MSKANQYQKLFADFAAIEKEMRDAPQDGQQRELQSAARAIVRFEVENQLPTLKQLVENHAAAVAAIEQAKQKLTRLERSIASQEQYIAGRFATTDTTTDALDLLGWRESARIGAQSIELLTANAVALETELRSFIKANKGVSDCLLVEQLHGWDKTTRESFAWLQRKIEQTATAEAQEKAA